jgi:hypothetical protein
MISAKIEKYMFVSTLVWMDYRYNLEVNATLPRIRIFVVGIDVKAGTLGIVGNQIRVVPLHAIVKNCHCHTAPSVPYVKFKINNC